MADRDASKVQLDFPQLTADLITDLRLTGVLGLLNLSDTVVPIISVGNVRPQVVRTDLAAFDSAEIFHGLVLAPGANSVLVDTGPLPEGTYDVSFGGSTQGSSPSTALVEFQWRNAANNANLAAFPFHAQNLAGVSRQFSFGPTALNIGLNERLVWANIVAQTAAVAGWIMAALRPTP